MKAAPGGAVASVGARRYWNLLQLKMVNNYRQTHSAISLLLVRRGGEREKGELKQDEKITPKERQLSAIWSLITHQGELWRLPVIKVAELWKMF